MAAPSAIPSVFTDDQQQPTIDRLIRRLDALQLQVPGGQLREPRLQDNDVLLSAGAFPFVRQQRPNLSVQGLGAQVAGMATDQQAVWSGVRFTEPVELLATANVRFSCCRFDQAVVMRNGARASFAECHFVKNVQNAGLAANAGVFGCRREGAAHVNVTVVFEQ